MSNSVSYKGYCAKVEYSTEDKVLYGKVEGIDDLVSFEAAVPADVEKEFQEAVDDYLSFCVEVGKAPNKVYKGNFNVRIEPQLHRELAMKAARENISQNQAVEAAIKQYLAGNWVFDHTYTLDSADLNVQETQRNVALSDITSIGNLRN